MTNVKKRVKGKNLVSFFRFNFLSSSLTAEGEEEREKKKKK